jgi:beta-lactamase regulating signal transducer with metallopeptidase domain
VLRADRAFGILLALAAFSSAILLALLGVLLWRSGELLARGPDDAVDLIAVPVLLLATVGIALGLGSLFGQLFATARLIRTLLAREVPVPRRVHAAADGLGLNGRIDVVSDRRPFSFCYWFLRPRICLSTGLIARLAADELRSVLLHERYHLRHRDPLRLVIARYFAAGLYVVPVVEELVEYYTLEKELEADEDAVAELKDVRPLAAALYKLLPDADEVSLGLLVPVSALSVTEARIDQLVNGRHLRLRLSAGSVALSGGALAAAAVLAAVHWPGAAAPAPLLRATALAAPAALLFAAAVPGGLHQARLVTRR